MHEHGPLLQGSVHNCHHSDVAETDFSQCSHHNQIVPRSETAKLFVILTFCLLGCLSRSPVTGSDSRYIASKRARSLREPCLFSQLDVVSDHASFQLGSDEQTG
jgi:hypothetical protein